MGKTDQEISLNDENNDASLAEPQRAISIRLVGHLLRQLRVLHHVVFAVTRAYNADFLGGVALSNAFERCLEVLVVRVADLDGVEHLVEGIINADDLHVVKH